MSNLNIANDYNLFILNDVNIQNTNIEGSFTIFGNANLTNCDIGNKLVASSPFATSDTFVICGNTLNISGGNNFAGNTIVSEKTNINTYTMNNINGDIIIDNPIDLDIAKQYIECLSLTWGNISPNSSVLLESDSLTFTGMSNTFNIFKFDSTNIANTGLGLNNINIKTINIIAPEKSTLLINVLDTNVTFGNCKILINGKPATPENAQYIIWNFPFALYWTNGRTDIYGSILAPFATAITQNYKIYGNIIFNNLNGSIQAYNSFFVGDIPIGICTSTTTTSTTTTSSTTTSTQNPCTTFQLATNIIESITLEEASIANLINSETYKIQKAIKLSSSLDELLLINDLASDTLEKIINTQILLNTKFKNINKLLEIYIQQNKNSYYK